MPLAGGPLWFDRVEVLTAAGSKGLLAARELPEDVAARLRAPRTDIAGLSLDQPRIMAVLNVTPDSFSDGGDFVGGAALAGAERLIGEGADLLDIGGESTRPGADFVDAKAEVSRVLPVIEALAGKAVLSIDTRKADVAEAALGAGAKLFNDVSALEFDERSAGVAAESGAALCLMHSKGDPKTMQKRADYANVLLEVYDYLEARISVAEAAGVPRARILVDPGIGFGKTLEHNLELIRGLSLFHGLGCGILLGVSRKRFIGTIGGAEDAKARGPGSIAIALEGLRQGVQMLRVHDMSETKQAVALWQAARPKL